MNSRFRLSRLSGWTEIVFDDGGMNLLSTAALNELAGVLRVLQQEDDVAPLVFRSGRSNVFAAGADMAEMACFSGWDAWEFSRLGQEVFAGIEALSRLTVAVIDGDCFGGALDLTLAFDLRIATPRSRFAHPGARLGIVTGFGGTSRWRAMLTRAAANRLFLANAVLPAAEALETGLVDELAVTPAQALERFAAHLPDGSRGIVELARRADALDARELLLMSRLLSRIYSGA